MQERRQPDAKPRTDVGGRQLLAREQAEDPEATFVGDRVSGRSRAAGGSAGPRRCGKLLPSVRKAKVIELVREIAESAEGTPSQVCIAWVLARREQANLIPILGARTAQQLEENLGALEVVLAPELLAPLEEATAIPPGFPSTFLADQDVVELIFGRTRALIEG
jgi:hypothetical protein